MISADEARRAATVTPLFDLSSKWLVSIEPLIRAAADRRQNELFFETGAWGVRTRNGNQLKDTNKELAVNDLIQILNAYGYKCSTCLSSGKHGIMVRW